MSDAEKLSPMVDEVPIGIREIKTLNIYPLSIADQKTLTKELSEAIRSFFAETEEEIKKPEEAKSEAEEDENGPFSSDIQFVDFIINLIFENLVKLLQLTTDHATPKQAEKLLSDITNNQAVEIALVVYKQNFESASKNVKSLLGGIRGLFQSKRLSRLSALDIPDTDSKNSTGNHSEKED